VCDTGNVRIYGGANVLQYLLRVGSTAGKMGDLGNQLYNRA
jgi:hypothetical protein